MALPDTLQVCVVGRAPAGGGRVMNVDKAGSGKERSIHLIKLRINVMTGDVYSRLT